MKKVLSLLFISLFTGNAFAFLGFGEDESPKETKAVIAKAEDKTTDKTVSNALYAPNNPLLDADYSALLHYYDIGKPGNSCIAYSKHLQGVNKLNNQKRSTFDRSALSTQENWCKESIRMQNISWQYLVDPRVINRYQKLKREEDCKEYTRSKIMRNILKNDHKNSCYPIVFGGK